MAITFTQSKYSVALTTNTLVITPTNPPAAGNLLVMPVMWINTLTVLSVIDSAGNVFTQCTGAASAGSGTYQSDAWYCENCIAGTCGYIVTITMSGTAQRLRGVFTEWAGAAVTEAFDSADSLSGPGAPMSPPITPSVAGELLIAVLASNDNEITGRSAPWISLTAGPFESHDVSYYINPPLSQQQLVYQPPDSENFGSSIASFLEPAIVPPDAAKFSLFLAIP